MEHPTDNFVADTGCNSVVYNIGFTGRFCERGGWFRSTESWVDVWLCHLCPSLKCSDLYTELVEELPVFCLVKGVWFLCSRTALESAVSKEEGCASKSSLALNQKADVDREILVEEALTLTINFKVNYHILKNTQNPWQFQILLLMLIICVRFLTIWYF